MILYEAWNTFKNIQSREKGKFENSSTTPDQRHHMGNLQTLISEHIYVFTQINYPHNNWN